MFKRKWEVVYDNFCSTGNGAGKHLFYFKRSAQSWANLTQSFTPFSPRLQIHWYVRPRKVNH